MPGCRGFLLKIQSLKISVDSLIRYPRNNSIASVFYIQSATEQSKLLKPILGVVASLWLFSTGMRYGSCAQLIRCW